VLNKNKDVINTKINLLKRQIDASDKELLAMREKRNASTQGQTKAKAVAENNITTFVICLNSRTIR